VIVQFGGQTPLRLAVALEKNGVPILGTTPDAIDRAEDRERFDQLLEALGLKRPPSGIARSLEEAQAVAERIGYPVLVRPSYVLGGRAMQIVHDAESLAGYMKTAVKASPEHPVLVDRFLNDAIEVDVDAISDGKRVVIGGVMEHIEEAGIHSGDSACSLPPYSLGRDVVDEIVESTRRLALELGVVGLMNVQYAVKGKDVYVLEVNPRASRTVPFVAKAIGRPLAKLAALVMGGKTLEELAFTREIWPRHFSVKEAVFPFLKFPGVDTVLGPEMKSTGEVMGIDSDFGRAYAKAQIEAGNPIPATGRLFVSVRDEDQGRIAAPLREFAESGFQILATAGTAKALEAAGIAVETVAKVGEGAHDVVSRIDAGEVDLVINTVEADPRAVKDSFAIRRSALQRGLPYFTTFAAVRAAAGAVRALRQGTIGVRSLQEVHRAA
jgi:carbamoyl-phosphate synthase large subunit